MTAWELVRLVLGGVSVLFGVFIMVTAVIGSFRFDYVLLRMHAAGMGDTLGIGAILLGITVLEGFSAFTGKLWLVLLLLWVTSPTASHRIARMELRNGAPAGKEEKP